MDSFLDHLKRNSTAIFAPVLAVAFMFGGFVAIPLVLALALPMPLGFALALLWMGVFLVIGNAISDWVDERR